MHWFRAFRLFVFSAFVLMGPPGLIPHASSQNQRVDLELVLAVDISGSIDEEEAKLQRKGYIDALASPEVISAIRSGYHKRIAVTYIE